MARKTTKVKQIKDSITRGVEVTRDRITSASRKTGKYITKHPKKAVAIAAGVGAVIGAAILAGTRRKRRLFH